MSKSSDPTSPRKVRSCKVPRSIRAGRSGRKREAERNWEALVDARLSGTVQPLSSEAPASIDAAERALRVGKYR